jgi:hypothetical protein
MNSEKKTVKKFDNLKKNLIKDGYNNNFFYEINENKPVGRMSNNKKEIIKKIILKVNKNNKKEIGENNLELKKTNNSINNTKNTTINNSTKNIIINYSKEFNIILNEINVCCDSIKKLELEKKDFKEKLKNFIIKIENKKRDPSYYKGTKAGILKYASLFKNREANNKDVIEKSIDYAKFYLYKIYENSKKIITNKIKIEELFSSINKLVENFNSTKVNFNRDIENEVKEINSFIVDNIKTLKNFK